ncbi:hypothetical protein DVW02_16445 [Clostridium botulinum]|nr:hypothetical protein [Clostridium botulinum]
MPLSCILIVYILKAQENRDCKQEEREQNYQKIDYLEDNNMDMAEIKFLFAEHLVNGKKVTFVIGRGIFGSFYPKNCGG